MNKFNLLRVMTPDHRWADVWMQVSGSGDVCYYDLKGKEIELPAVHEAVVLDPTQHVEMDKNSETIFLAERKERERALKEAARLADAH